MMIHKAIDGSVAITTFAPEIENEAKAVAVERFKAMHPGIYLESYEGEYELPDGQFRDAWTFSDNKIVIDEQKAHDIHMSRIRTARNAALAKLDIEHLRSLPDDAKIKEKKQTLRDLPANINGLEWPAILEKV